ncbi:MAG: hypothetical protein AAB531_00865 [Patescibacteria group bacterium]
MESPIKDIIEKGQKPDPTEIYEQALAESPVYKNFSQDEIKSLIATSIDEIAYLEEVGEKDKAKFEIPDDVLRRIGAIWIFSGPGTYDSPTKDDKYNTFPWARWMDRDRLNHAALLARKVAEVRSGQGPIIGSLETLQERKEKTRQMIEEFGPQIVYNGTQLEDDTVASVLSRDGTIIPEDKVDIIRENIAITLDQIRTFKLPDNFEPDQELALITHAPQFLRITRMLNANPPFPVGTKVRLFPVPTPAIGKREYSKMEVLGLLKYTYVDHVATAEPYPFQAS